MSAVEKHFPRYLAYVGPTSSCLPVPPTRPCSPPLPPPSETSNPSHCPPRSPLAMGFWKWHPGKKTKHDHEAWSSSSSGSAANHSTSLASFSISSSTAAPRFRPYVKIEVCRRYWETGTPLLWSHAHLPNGWHLSPDRVPIPPVPASGRARLQEIARRRARILCDLLSDRRYDVDSPLWDTWFQDEHDMRRQIFFCRPWS